MVIRTTEEWHSLFTAKTTSGLSQKHFCKQQGLCPKHFSKRKKELLTSHPSEPMLSGFIKVESVQPSIEVIGDVSIVYQDKRIVLSGQEASFVAAVINGLR